MQIPQLDSLSTNRLSRVFNNTVATYKYYWLISILNIHMSTGATRIIIWDIVISMIANAWYPIHYFKLSFGKSDSMYVAIKTIREITGLPYDASKKLIEDTLKSQLDKKEIKAALKVFTYWTIELNPAWCDYLKQHYSILLDFSYWNLIPSNPSINSSKSDRIPDLDFYLPNRINSWKYFTGHSPQWRRSHATWALSNGNTTNNYDDT